MRYEVVRTFPVSRNRGFEFVRDLGSWSLWTPVDVDPAEMTFGFTPMTGVTLPGTLTVTEEIEHEKLAVAFVVRGFPALAVTLAFGHAGPGAFTLHVEMLSEPEGIEQLVEGLSLMAPVVRMSMNKALDKLEHYFLGDLEVEAGEEEAEAGVEVEEPAPVG